MPVNFTGDLHLFNDYSHSPPLLMVFSYPLICLFEKVSGRVTDVALPERSNSNIALCYINKIRKLMRNKITNLYHIRIYPKQRDLEEFMEL
jgi:hypothetical protein